MKNISISKSLSYNFRLHKNKISEFYFCKVLTKDTAKESQNSSVAAVSTGTAAVSAILAAIALLNRYLNWNFHWNLDSLVVAGFVGHIVTILVRDLFVRLLGYLVALLVGLLVTFLLCHGLGVLSTYLLLATLRLTCIIINSVAFIFIMALLLINSFVLGSTFSLVCCFTLLRVMNLFHGFVCSFTLLFVVNLALFLVLSFIRVLIFCFVLGMAFWLVRGLVGRGMGLMIGGGRGMVRGGGLMVSRGRGVIGGGGLVIRRGGNFIESRSSGRAVGVCVMGRGRGVDRGVAMRIVSTSAMPVVMVVTAISQANSYQQREDYQFLHYVILYMCV